MVISTGIEPRQEPDICVVVSAGQAALPHHQSTHSTTCIFKYATPVLPDRHGKNFLPGPGLEPGPPALRTETLALSHRSLHGTELDLLLVRRPFPPGKKKLDRTGIEPELPPSDLRALTIEPIHPFCHHAGTHSSRRTIGPSAQLPIVACSHIHDFFRTPFSFFRSGTHSFLAHTPGDSTGAGIYSVSRHFHLSVTFLPL